MSHGPAAAWGLRVLLELLAGLIISWFLCRPPAIYHSSTRLLHQQQKSFFPKRWLYQLHDCRVRGEWLNEGQSPAWNKINHPTRLFVVLFLLLASESHFSTVPAHTNLTPSNTRLQVMLCCSLLIPAMLSCAFYCSVCVFPQGLQENVDGWEDEENPVSDAHHLHYLLIYSFFLECTLFLFSLSFLGELMSLSRGLVKSVTHKSVCWMMGCSWPFSSSLPICAGIVLTLAMWLH